MHLNTAHLIPLLEEKCRVVYLEDCIAIKPILLQKLMSYHKVLANKTGCFLLLFFFRFEFFVVVVVVFVHR